jgi:RNA polymerase sigma factor (TIGR02999 family)
LSSDDRRSLMNEVTKIIHAIEAGDRHAAAELLPLVYEELRVLAAQRLAQEKPGQTLEPTALVHEAYVRLVGDAQDGNWDHRGHFFAAAAEAMRRILVDAARRKQAIRHGGGKRRVPLQDHQLVTQSPDAVVAVDEALSRFAREEPAKAELVKLRFFAGLSMPEAASALGISVASAERWWAFARTWLFSELQDEVGR